MRGVHAVAIAIGALIAMVVCITGNISVVLFIISVMVGETCIVICLGLELCDRKGKGK